MRLTLVTFGSEGDTRPLAALCRGLLDRGHELKLFAEGSTLSLPRALGIPCEALAGDIRSAMPIGDPRQEVRIAELVKTGKNVSAIIAANAASWLRTLAEHARDSDAILFSSFGLGPALVLREELRKPAIGVFFQPTTPTRAFSSPIFPPLKLPGWANLLTYRIAHAQWWKSCGESMRAARAEVFGTKASHRPPFDYPSLVGVSRELVSQPQDWPTTHRICGHWSRPMANWQPPAELAEFLAAGEPPIYAGFGSPSAFIRTKALNALIGAVGGRRAVFSPGWSQIDSSVLPQNFFIAHGVPHEWLFTRVSVAIHHGGAGTTHTAARAGVPQVILPLGADQHFWASRVAARGAAPKYKNGARMNSAALAKLIESAQSTETQRCAKRLADAMSRENGVEEAAQRLDQLVSRSTVRSPAPLAIEG